MENWKIQHESVINDFLEYINNVSDVFVLKGGTALMKCYGLDRFSEDIDLDATPLQAAKLRDLMSDYSKNVGYSYRIAKDTETVQRYMLNYGGSKKPLKIETSFRRKVIREEDTVILKGIKTYDINVLSIMKSNAYSSRDKIRDLFDLAFICNNYYSNLTLAAVEVMRSAVEYKGIEQFDYIIREQSDELIDVDRLEDSFLRMYDKLGLLYTPNEREEILFKSSLHDTLATNQKTLSLDSKLIKAVEKSKAQTSHPKSQKPDNARD